MALSQQLKYVEATVARTESRVADVANRKAALSQQLKRIERRVNHTDHLVAGKPAMDSVPTTLDANLPGSIHYGRNAIYPALKSSRSAA